MSNSSLQIGFQDATQKKTRRMRLSKKQQRIFQQQDVAHLFPDADVNEPVEFQSALAELLQESEFQPEDVAEGVYLRAYLTDESLFPTIGRRWKRAVRTMAKQRHYEAIRINEQLPPHERILLHEDLKRMTTEGYMRCVFMGQEIPNGRLTLAICDWLAVSPVILADPQSIDPQPAYVIEAVVLDAQRQLKRKGRLDETTANFLDDQLVLTKDLAKMVDSYMNARRLNPVPFKLFDYLDNAERHYHAGESYKNRRAEYKGNEQNLSPVEYQLKYLEDVLDNEGRVWQRTIEAREKVAQQWKDYRNTWNLVRQCAAELAPSGKANAFIEAYRHYANDHGHKRAARILTLDPDKISPMRTGWRYNAGIQSLQEKGEQVLKQFIAQVKRLDDMQRVHSIAPGFIDGARKDKQEWRILVTSPVIGPYIRAEANARHILAHLQEVLVPSMKMLPPPAPMQLLSGPV